MQSSVSLKDADKSFHTLMESTEQALSSWLRILSAILLLSGQFKSAFPASAIGEKLAKVENHQNAIVAFSLARTALHKAKILRDDQTFEVEQPIKISGHSYGDIVEALANITPNGHFKLVTVLFEQLVYKSNPECQYEIF